MRPAFAIALLLFLLLPGCMQQAAPAPQQPTDYSYDLVVKDITTWPRTVYVGQNYSVRATFQIYGRHPPLAYHVNFLDGNQTLYDGNVYNPELIHWVELNMTKAGEEPKNLRAEITNIDPLHPEPESIRSNNMMRKTIFFQPIGYYGTCDACMHLYYDAVNFVMRQAQSFTVDYELDVHRIGFYLRAPFPNRNDSAILVELRNDTGGKPGPLIATSSINAGEVGPELGWHYAHFQNVTVPPGKYWITLMINDTKSYGVQWARSEGNPYGEMLDTMVLDLMDWPEWDYKLFDFVFQIY